MSLEPSSESRSTRIRPERVSATKISPFGAVLISRGPLNPSARSSILNPAGTCGIAEAGRGTTCETLADEAVAPGFGKSEGRIRRTRPGLSARQSPNAAVPVSGCDWAKAGIEAATTPAPASAATSNAGIDCRTRPNRCALEILGGIAAGRFMFAILFVDNVEAEGIGWALHRREGIGALTTMCTVNQVAAGPSYQQQALSAASESGTFGCAMHATISTKRSSTTRR